MKKKLSSLLVIISLLFSHIELVHAENSILDTEESLISASEEIETLENTNHEEIGPDEPEETTTPTSTEPITETPTDTEETVVLPQVTAQLHVIANGGILFRDIVEVVACTPYTGSEQYTLNARCLVEQAPGITSTWSTYGIDSFLDSINGIQNDFNTNSYWGYFINNEYGSIALNQYILTEGDTLLINYNTIPLKLEFSTTTPVIGDAITISVYEFGFDEFWEPAWLPATEVLLSIDNGHVTTTDHTFTFIPATTTPYLIRGEKEGYVTIEKTLVATTTHSIDESTENNGGTVGDGGSSGGSVTTPVERMIQFLDSVQNTDGSFGSSPFLSDWTALAYGSWRGASTGAVNLKNYLITDPNPLDGPNVITNYARRSMALMALGINPYSGTPTNYIEKIISGFDGTQFGETGLINDDIFALVPLIQAGYRDDAIVASTTKFIIEKQSANGSFGSIDLTAAAIQALSPLSSIEGVGDALTRARTYLKSAQRTDGGFGDVYATGWALQAISALGDTDTEWLSNGNSPVSYITQKQAADGGLLSEDTTANRIWSTAYAIPGLLKTSWNTILASFAKPSTIPETGNTGSSTTSTIEITTSTIPLTTNTSTPTTTTKLITDNVAHDSTIIAQTTTPEPRPRTIAPTPSIVRGERIVERTTDDTQEAILLSTSTSELMSTSTEEITTPEPPSPIARYIFWSSTTALLLILGYSWFTRSASKK